MKNDGLFNIRSSYSVNDTVRRLERILFENDMTVFAKIDHSKNANQANLSLRDTIVLIFGAPHIGTLLMQENQRIGLDLPSKALVWKDEKGIVWLTRNQTSFLTKRYGIKESTTSLALEKKVNKLLYEVVAE